MKALTLLTILGLLTVLAVPGYCTTPGEIPPQENGKSLTRVYDITTLNLPFHDVYRVGTLRLAPFSPGTLKEKDLAGEDYPVFDADSIEYLLYSIVGGEQFEYDGVHMGSLGKDKLLVTGPESIHRIVSHVLAIAENHLNRKITIDVEIYKAETETSLESDDVSSIRQAADAGTLRLVLKQQCRTVPGGFAEISTEKTGPLILDYDPEIAQSSLAYETVIREISTGLTISLRPFAAPDGRTLLVGLHGLYSEIINAEMKRDLRFKGRLSTSDKIDIISVSNSVDSPAIEFASLATVVPLEPEKTAVIRTAFPHQSGMGSLVILLTAHAPQPANRLELGEGLFLSALDFGFLAAENLLPVKFMREGPFCNENFYGTCPYEDCTITSLGQRGRMVRRGMDEIFGLMINETIPPGTEYDSSGDSFSFDESRGYLLGSLIVFRAEKEFCNKMTQVACRMFSAESALLNTTVRFIETPGPAVLTDVDEILRKGKLVGVMSLPMLPGGRAASLAGLEGFMVEGYDVDAANEASGPNPRVQRYLDGVFVRLGHHPALSPSTGAGVIQAELYVNRLAGPIATRHLGENGGMLGVIDQPEFDHGLFQTRFPVDNALHVIGVMVGKRNSKNTTIYIVAGSKTR